MTVNVWAILALVVWVWLGGAAGARAQPDDSGSSAGSLDAAERDADAALAGDPFSESSSPSIGGLPEPSRRKVGPHPLQTFGVDLGLGTYAVNAIVGLVYLASVYPVQALLGTSKVEPLALWLLVPIAGPWFAQYTHLVKGSPVARGILIADAGLQATGLVLGLIGAALSGGRSSSPTRAGRIELQLAAAGFVLRVRTQ
jgi:hypothetical protein